MQKKVISYTYQIILFLNFFKLYLSNYEKDFVKIQLV